MLDDLTKEIKAQLYERVRSPLFGAFALSWVGWNYRALLGALSDMPFKDRMAYLDGLYPTAQDWFWHCIGSPLLTAIAFLFLYPWPARWMYFYWAWQQKELKKVQQKIEDETPITQEEANALRKAGLAQTKEFHSQLEGLTATNKELEAQIKELQDDNGRLENERRNFEESARRADEQLSAAQNHILSPAQQHVKKSDLKARLAIALDQLPRECRDVLIKNFPDNNKVEREVFMTLVAGGGSGNEATISNLLDLNPLDVQPAVQTLIKMRLIQRSEASRGMLVLHDEGKQLARNTRLTSILPRLSL